MAIRVQCESCGSQFTARDELAGKHGKCPKCQAPIRVPEAARKLAPDPPAAIARSARTAPMPGATAAKRPAKPVGKSANGPVSAKPATTAAGRAAVAQQLLGNFQRDIRRVRVSLLYRLGTVLTAIVMVLLPIAYVALIGLAGLGVYYHAVNHASIATMGTGRGRLIAISAYVGPIIAGVILVFFMLKPLFARPATMGRTRSLTRAGEPVLFGFVDRICRAVGARQPVRIEVDSELNAAAALDRTAFKLFRNRLVLRIGVPLVAGLNASQLAGVLAHEFGHFTQGAGLRLSYLIRSINVWFLRVVYQRDAWDQWLEESAAEWDFRVGWILQLARLAVVLSRGILWVFMILGHTVSSFMSRQMEYHADAHEARLVGGETFASTERQIGRLGLGYQAALNDMGNFVEQGSFADDLPQLMLARMEAVPPQVWHELDRRLAEVKTGWFDTHPAPRDRIRRAAVEGNQPVFADDRPAVELFSDFKALSRGVTWDLYRAYFGSRFQPSMMRPTEQLLRIAEACPSEPSREIDLE